MVFLRRWINRKMNENVYQAPESDVEIVIDLKGSPVKAIVLGLLIGLVGAMFVAMLIGIGFSAYWASIGLSLDEISKLSQNNTSLLVAYLIESLIFSVCSGHYVAKKTNYNEYGFCFIMIVIGTLMGVVAQLLAPDLSSRLPDWYMYIGYMHYPLAVMGGCWLSVKSKV